MDLKTEMDLARRISALEYDMDQASMVGASVHLSRLKAQMSELQTQIKAANDALAATQDKLHRAERRMITTREGGFAVFADDAAVAASIERMAKMLLKIYGPSTGPGCPLCGHGSSY